MKPILVSIYWIGNTNPLIDQITKNSNSRKYKTSPNFKISNPPFEKFIDPPM
jgi:hypothetical protein